MNALLETPAGIEERTFPRRVALRYHQTSPGSEAEEDLVREHLPLVKNIVGRLAMSLPSHVEPDELYSVGMVGLLDAVRHYDPCAGSTFESYARVRIRGAIIDELRRLDWVPRSVHDKTRKVQEAIQRLEQQKGEVPTAEEVAAALGLTTDEYEQLLEEIKPATFICLDSVLGHDEGESDKHDMLADGNQPDPSEVAARHELAELVFERLKQLPDTQRKVLALYYYEDLRLREIAEVFGVTESRICQIHTQAILNIRALVKQAEELPA